MSGRDEQDNFVARWSRLKRESAARKKARAEPATPDRQPSDVRAEQAAAASGDTRPSPEAGREPRPERPFDPATLPPIDSIVADSDIRAFLQKGVPAELTRAALRRVWTADPAIRDFIGLAENQWDFTDPASIPGFGAIDATRDLPQLVAQALGKLPDMPESTALSDQTALSEESAAADAHADDAPAMPAQEAMMPAQQKPDDRTKSDDQSSVEIAAAQHPQPVSAIETAPARKGHGRALPR